MIGSGGSERDVLVRAESSSRHCRARRAAVPPGLWQPESRFLPAGFCSRLCIAVRIRRFGKGDAGHLPRGASSRRGAAPGAGRNSGLYRISARVLLRKPR